MFNVVYACLIINVWLLGCKGYFLCFIIFLLKKNFSTLNNTFIPKFVIDHFCAYVYTGNGLIWYSPASCFIWRGLHRILYTTMDRVTVREGESFSVDLLTLLYWRPIPFGMWFIDRRSWRVLLVLCSGTTCCSSSLAEGSSTTRELSVG